MGCHGGETGTVFLHVNPRSAGVEAQLSNFLSGQGSAIIDPVDGITSRQFFDLGTRKTNFECLTIRCDL